MTRFFILGASGLLWVLMMVALVRQEVLPYFEYQAPPSYRDILKDLRVAELTREEIQAAGVRVGDIESMAERLFDGTSRIRTRASMEARILGMGEKSTDKFTVRLKSETLVDALYRLQVTSCRIDLGFGVASIQGTRNGNLLNAKLELAQGKRILGAMKQTIELPKEGMIGDLFQPFPGGGSLYVGKKWKIPTMTADLAGPKLGWLYAAVTERETILWNDQPVETLRVEIRTEPTEEKRPTHISWCRADGIALKQQFTFQSLVYEIVFVSREPRTRGEAIVWGRTHYGGSE
jgi:hypothetical protein